MMPEPSPSSSFCCAARRCASRGLAAQAELQDAALQAAPGTMHCSGLSQGLTCRMKVDLPPMFGPVMMLNQLLPRSITQSLATNDTPS